MRDDIFRLEVPPPLHKFRGASQIDPNNEWLASTSDDVKIISKKQAKQAEKRLKAIERELKRARVDELLAEYHAIKDEYLRNTAELIALKKEADDLGITALLAEGRGADEDKKAEIRAKLEIPQNVVIIAHGRTLRQNIKSLYADVVELSQRLAPYRQLLATRERLKQRLTERETAILDVKIRAKLRLEMAQEANLYAMLIIRHWARLGYVFRYTKGKKQVTIAPRFERVIATEDEIQLKIASSRQGLIPGSVRNLLPNGVKAYDLVKPETLQELTIACERPITSPHTDEFEPYGFQNGAWLTIRRLGLTDGILDYVEYPQVMSRYDVSKKDKIPLPMGVKQGRHINWINLADHPHALVTGQNGSGKSNVMNMMLSTVISRQSPDEVRIILIDLKEGVELGRFARVPHVLGLLNDDINQVPKVLLQVEKERQKRMKMMKELGVTKIEEYNALMPTQPMPHLIVAIDEYGALLLDKDVKKDADNLCAQIAMKGRAAGVHLWIGSQTPYNDIIPNKVKANITLKIIGRQATQGASMSAGGSKLAVELPKHAGRMICDNGTDEFQVQMPYISAEQIAECIKQAELYPPSSYQFESFSLDEDTQPFEPITKPFDHERLAQIAIDQFGGVMPAQRIHPLVKDTGVPVRKVMAMIADIVANGGIEVNGEFYETSKYLKGYKLTRKLTDKLANIDTEDSVNMSNNDENEAKV